MHKNYYDEKVLREHGNKGAKKRWTEEEKCLIARPEVKLVREGKKWLSKELSGIFTERTYEAIKKLRTAPDYKAKVARYLEEEDSDESSEDEDEESELESDVEIIEQEEGEDAEMQNQEEQIIAYISTLPDIKTKHFSANTLRNICNNLGVWSMDRIYQELTIYLQTIFPTTKKVTRKNKQENNNNGVRVPTRIRRKQLYGETQRKWRKNPCKCLRTLLKDKVTDRVPDKLVMIPYWTTIMTQEGLTTPGIGNKKEEVPELWGPISEVEIEKAFPARGTAPGPDGVTARLLRSVPTEILLRIFNIFMLLGKIPEYLLESRTTLIPKKDEATEPGDFRPLTVSSVLPRTYHKILAVRILRHLEIDERQKAFRQTDGCAENIFLTDLILRHTRASYKSTYMASIDMAKAFDSVTHRSIEDTMINRGFPKRMVRYIMSTYQKSRTRLACDNWESEMIHPTCGVKQGDPLSPLLSILVIKRMLEELEEGVGVDIGHLKINAEAFADDIIFFASTQKGLQSTIDIATQFLEKCGLYINANKCFTISIEGLGQTKKSVVNTQKRFTCLGRQLPVLGRAETWKYLGEYFTATGCVSIDPLKRLKDHIQVLTKAPLKPQQRIFALKNVVIPGVYHLLTLGKVTMGTLKKADKISREAVRKWTTLPHDAPTAYFHACVVDGGLGIPSMRWNVPVIRLNRLRKVSLLQENAGVVATNFVELEIKRTLLRLKDQDKQITSATDVKSRWANLLYTSVDGGPLRKSNLVPQQHRWVSEGNKLVSGKDYINMLKFRINAMPVRARTSRGKTHDRRCRAGCPASETLNHVIQQCHRTHGARIKRHNAVVSYLARSMRNKWAQVIEEPKFKTPEGLRKPDLLAVEGDAALVIDVAIPSEQADLGRRHTDKIEYYRALENSIKQRYKVQRVSFSAAIISSRGKWCQRSVEELINLKVMKKNDIKIISTRVIIGGIYAFGMFNRMTTTTTSPRTARTGIG